MVPEPSTATRAPRKRGAPKRVIQIEITENGHWYGWCADIRAIEGRCPDGLDRACEECWCG